MNLATAVAIAVIAAAAVVAAVRLLRRPGSGTCGGDCGGCALKESCSGRGKRSQPRRRTGL